MESQIKIWRKSDLVHAEVLVEVDKETRKVTVGLIGASGEYRSVEWIRNFHATGGYLLSTAHENVFRGGKFKLSGHMVCRRIGASDVSKDEFQIDTVRNLGAPVLADTFVPTTTSAIPPAVKVSMTVAEAGRRGGNKNKEKGREYFATIGKLGGSKCRYKHNLDFYSTIGKKGAAVNKERVKDDPEYFKRIGKKGGTALRDKMGPDYMMKLSKKGGARAQEMMALGRKALEDQAKKK